MKAVDKNTGEVVFDTESPEYKAALERKAAQKKADDLGKAADKIEEFRKNFRGKKK